MDGTLASTEVRGGKDVKSVTMDKSLLDMVNALPNKTWKAFWTKEQDEALLAGWKTKNQNDMAAILGHCVETCRCRYRELMKNV